MERVEIPTVFELRRETVGSRDHFRKPDGLQWHRATPSTGVMTMTVHIVASLSVAERWKEPSRVSGSPCFIRRSDTRASCSLRSLAPRSPVHLLQLLARCTRQSDSLPRLIPPLRGLLVLLYLSHIIWRFVAESQTLPGWFLIFPPPVRRLCSGKQAGIQSLSTIWCTSVSRVCKQGGTTFFSALEVEGVTQPVWI